jgi:hypothetical protein
MLLPESKKRKTYMRFVKWYIEHHVDYKSLTDFDSFDFFLTSATHFSVFTSNVSFQKNMHEIFNQKRAGSNDSLSLIGKSFNLPFTFGSIMHKNVSKNQNIYFAKFIESEKNLLDEKTLNSKPNEIELVTIDKWFTDGNKKTPQWADFLDLSIDGKLIKQINCLVKTDSPYFRFGFKLFRNEGRLFGDGSIQSLDNNYVLHYAKNFLDEEIFFTTYRNGILENRDTYLDILASNNWFAIEIKIDKEDFLHFSINSIEIVKVLINKDIRQKVYMLAWADGNDFKIEVKDIVIQSCYA